MVEVSVVLPTLNEEKTIRTCIEKINEVFNDYNIEGEIIISDNSNDNSPKIAQALGAKVVTPDKLGYGYAYCYGFTHASGRYLVMGDADGTYDFSIIPQFLEPLRNGEADFIIGSRFKGKIKTGAMPWLHRYIGNPAITLLFNIIFGAKLSDACSGMFALTRNAWDKMSLTANGWDFNQEMLMNAIKKGVKITEVPVCYHSRLGGVSKVSSFRGGWQNLKFLLTHLFIRFRSL